MAAYLSRVLSGKQKVSNRVSRLLTDNSKAIINIQESAARIGNTPKGIRIPVGSVKGCCPRPLDDGGVRIYYSKYPY